MSGEIVGSAMPGGAHYRNAVRGPGLSARAGRRASIGMIGLLLVFLPTTGAGAVNLETKEMSDQTVTTIMLTGHSEAGDGLKVRGYVGGLPRGKAIVAYLAFSGGVRGEAMSIGRFFHQAGVRTVVPKGARCISPCPLVLVGGTDPITKKGSYLKYSSARIGFSGIMLSFPDKVYTATDLDNAVAGVQSDILQIADYLQAVGAKRDMLRFYESVLKPNEVRYLSDEETLDLGIPVLDENTGKVIEPLSAQRY